MRSIKRLFTVNYQESFSLRIHIYCLTATGNFYIHVTFDPSAFGEINGPYTFDRVVTNRNGIVLDGTLAFSVLCNVFRSNFYFSGVFKSICIYT